MPEIETLGLQLSRAAKPFNYRYAAGEALSALRAVRFDAATGRVLYCRPPELEARLPLGITTSAAASIGDEITVRRDGELTDGSWTWTPGAPVLLAANGVLTQSQPALQTFMVVLGVAMTSTTIVIDIQPALFIAP